MSLMLSRNPDAPNEASDSEKLEAQLERIADALPARAGGFLRWLKRPSSQWVRIPAGLLLMLCGVVGFLPILGFWMLPLGGLLLAQDIPILRRPTLRLLDWGERKWRNWKKHRRDEQ